MRRHGGRTAIVQRSSDDPPREATAHGGARWSEHLASVLTGPGARTVLEAVVQDAGAELHDTRVRSVHRRGTSSVAVVHHVDLTDGDGRRPARLYVTHASRRAVPTGAATVTVDGTDVHVWRFPHDPYLPGLPGAVDVAAARALLERRGHRVHGRPGIRTRSYRPTRRAVVELRAEADRPPVAYVKLLGGRDRRRVRARATELAAAHEHLLAAGLPVPPVLGRDADRGRVVLGALPGTTLRETLRSGGSPPAAVAVVDLLRRLHATPPPPTRADPDGFADVERHVRLLRARLPGRSRQLREVAAVASDVGGPIGTIHGDLHDGQLLVDDHGISALLDVDGVGTGHLAHDVGRLLAGVETTTLVRTGAAADRAAAYRDDLLAAATGLVPERAVARAAAAAWVGLATGPVRVASPTWREEVEERLDRALAWARAAG